MLKYPEGTACAEVLKAGASPESTRRAPSGRREARGDRRQGTSATTIFTGFGIGLVYKAAMEAFKAWKDVPEKIFGAPLAARSISAEISPELLGVGYIIGPRIASIMCARRRARVSGAHPGDQVLRRARCPSRSRRARCSITEMGPDEIRGAYVLYIGAGAVAAGGIISLLARRCRPSGTACAAGSRTSASRQDGRVADADVPRTDRDLSMKVVASRVARARRRDRRSRRRCT